MALQEPAPASRGRWRPVKGYAAAGVLGRMPPRRVSPSQYVLVLQALVARELVEGMGLSGNRAAALLGVAPSAISQYLRGKRHVVPADGLEARPEVQDLVHQVAQALAADRSAHRPSVRPLLEAAATLHEEFEGVAPP